MTLNTFRAAVEAALSGGWTTTPIYYGADAPHSLEPQWVRVNVYPAASGRANIGGGYMERETGYVRVEMYVSEEDGEGTLMGYYETLAAIFRGNSIGGATFRSPDYRADGRDSGWLRATMDVEYYRDTCY